MQKPTFRSRKFRVRKPSRGFSLMELLIYLALAAVFIGGILTLMGDAGEDAEVRTAVQEISDIHNAIRGFYGNQRRAGAPGTAGAMEAAAAAQLDHLAVGSTLETQFGTPIDIIGAAGTPATQYNWPSYIINYTGMRTETCAALLAALTGPRAVRIGPGTVAAVAAWDTAATGDEREEAGWSGATDVDGFCDSADGAGTGETYTIDALYRI